MYTNGICNIILGLTALRHEVAVPIDLLVQDLDLKEEAISTLLYYLEFQGHVEVLNVINDVVTMKCYGGSNHLQHLASRIVAINEAFKIEKDKGRSHFGCMKIIVTIIALFFRYCY